MSVEEFINEACRLNKWLDESSGKPSTYEVLTAVKKSVNDPDDVQSFMDKYAAQIKDTEDKLAGKKKSVFIRAVSCIWYAIKKGTGFILKHWRLVLLAVLTIVLFIWFGSTGPGYAFGAKLFGHGNAWNGVSTKIVNGMKVKADTLTSIVSRLLKKSKPNTSTDVMADVTAQLGFEPKEWAVVDDDDIAPCGNGLDHIDAYSKNSFMRCGNTVDGEPVFALVDAAGTLTHLVPVK